MLGIQTAHAATEGGIAIHLAPHVLGHIFGIPVTNTLLTVWLSMAIVIVMAFFVGRSLKMVPRKLQSLFEMLIGTVYDYMAEVLESKDMARRYFPLVMTIFIFILAMNWTGLLPGLEGIMFHTDHGETTLFHPGAADLNVTIAFALIAFLTIEIAGVLALGIFKYAGKFINFSSPLGFIIGIIELISELARLISFSFRLFGNIFAGKTLLVVVLFFVPYVLPVPLMAFEVFVGFIQAFVFAILTLFFIKLAITEPH
ncbi:F0F1 ATP synthase subunit A [Candidatus Kaiserbacteria bacterium]|nr:F0F1 ATP synthase subunit A [Candidatus Kaiserbacteria bacterium]